MSLLRDRLVDWNWADRFLPEIKGILGQHLILTGSEDEDRRRVGDLTELTLGGLRVGCRVRRPHFLARFPEEFTIRITRPNGIQTELDKIMAGWGDYLFYGFADAAERALAAWLIGDLTVFRATVWQAVERGRPLGRAKANGDGSSDFLPYRIDWFPPAFVVARKAPPDQLRLVGT